jgi:hypothetical protein
MERYIVPMPQISLVTASFVTRELGYGSMTDWSEGDTATQEFFAPADTYPERIDVLIGEIADLRFRTIDLWGAHLHHSWATGDHFEAIRSSLDRHGIEVNSLAAWCSSVDALEGFCRVANEVGAGIIGGDLVGSSPKTGKTPSPSLPITMCASPSRITLRGRPTRS